jgi:hypothetical protein
MAQINNVPDPDRGGAAGVNSVAVVAIVILVILAFIAVYLLFLRGGDSDVNINVDASPVSHSVTPLAWRAA